MLSIVATPVPTRRNVVQFDIANQTVINLESTQGTGQSACSGQRARCFSFGRFVLVPARQLLLENGVPVRIGGRAFDILSVLACRPGDTVDKAELMAQVWGRTVVEQGNLKVNMAALRRVLGERREAPLYIATINGRGYKFIAAVQISDFEDLPSASTTGLGGGSASYRMMRDAVSRDSTSNEFQAALSDSHLALMVKALGKSGRTTVSVDISDRAESDRDFSFTFIDRAGASMDAGTSAAQLFPLGNSSLRSESLRAVVAVLAKCEALLASSNSDDAAEALDFVFCLGLSAAMATAGTVLTAGCQGGKLGHEGDADTPQIADEVHVRGQHPRSAHDLAQLPSGQGGPIERREILASPNMQLSDAFDTEDPRDTRELSSKLG